VFEDLNYDELKRRANSSLPDPLVATLQARGVRRSLAVGETQSRRSPVSVRLRGFGHPSGAGIPTDWCWAYWSLANSRVK
jgi:hypothetical protein